MFCVCWENFEFEVFFVLYVNILDVHFLRGAAQVRAGVHAQAASTTAKAVALGSVLAGVAVLAVQFLFVFSAVGRVQHFLAHAALEARLVVFVATSNALFGSVDGLLALGAFWVFNWLERHLD